MGCVMVLQVSSSWGRRGYRVLRALSHQRLHGHVSFVADPHGTGDPPEDAKAHEDEGGRLGYRRQETLSGPALGEGVRPGDLVAARRESFHARREGARHVDCLELVRALLEDEVLPGSALGERVCPRDLIAAGG